MPLYDNVLNLVSGEIQNQKGLASIEQMKAETALRMAAGQQLQQQMKISNATHALMLADAAAQQNAPQPPVAAATADTPALPFADEYNAVKDNLATAKRMQAIARRAGDSAGMEKWNDNVRESSNNLATVGEKQYAEVQKQLQQKANIAAGVNDQESLNNASAAIGQQFGPQAKAKFDAAFMDPTAGIPVYNAAAQKKLNTMSTQFTDASKQASEKLALMQYQRQIAEDKQRVKHQTAQEKHATQEESLQREGLAVRRSAISAANTRQDKALEAAGLRVDTKVLGDFSKQVEGVSKQYKLPEFQHSNDVASRVETLLKDPAQGYEAVTTANARQLVEQFRLSADNYQRLVGSKYGDVQINKMNSTLDKLEKFTMTIGEGDKLLAKDVMLSTTKAIKDLYIDQNIAAAKKELRLADTLKRRGQDPTLITYNADIPALEKAGMAKKVTIDGKQFLAFGPNKEDIYAMPAAPERKVIPVETDVGAQ